MKNVSEYFFLTKTTGGGHKKEPQKKCSFFKNWYNTLMDSKSTLMFTKIEFFIIDHQPKALK